MRLPVEQLLPLDQTMLVRRLSDLLTAIARQVNGLTEGGIASIHSALTAAPTTGTWAQGDFVRNATPVDGGSGDTILGWLCVASGTPGTWLEVGGGGGGGVSDGDKVDITVSASGATWTIDNNVVTYAKMQDVTATQRVIGRNSGGAGDPEEVASTQVLDWIGSSQGSVLYRGSSAWSSLVPGTKRKVLTTAGSGANPSWDSMTVRQVTTATYSVVDADVGHWLDVDTSATATATLTTASGHAVGETTIFSQRGTGQVIVAAGTGVRLRPSSATKTRAVDSVIAATRVNDDGSGTAVYSVFGDTA
jgi:hypothetical protein